MEIRDEGDPALMGKAASIKLPAWKPTLIWGSVAFFLHAGVVFAVAYMAEHGEGREAPLAWWLLVFLDLPSSALYPVWAALLGGPAGSSSTSDAAFFLLFGGAQYACIFMFLHIVWGRLWTVDIDSQR
jgi:hypothetical protein